MNFLTPAFLWSFLALIPLAAIYFLKVRPRKRSTTAYFLWERIFNEKRATSLFNKLRDVISLILLALVFSALALALAQPEFTDDERKDLLLIVDHSASMSANGRLDEAKKTAREIVVALNGNQRAAVASAARDIAFRSHLSVSPRELIDAIDAIEPSDFPFDPAALESLGQDAQWGDEHRVILISDASFEGAGELPKEIEFIKSGDAAENVGIVAADLQQLPSGQLAFFFKIASSFEESVEADLVLEHADKGRIYKLIPLNLLPGENPAEVFNLEDAPPGKWLARIEIEDALEKDNTAFLAVPDPQPIRVAVATEDRYFFETSVLAFQQGSGLLQLVDTEPQIAIGKGSAPDSELSLIFTPAAAESPWWNAAGEETDAVAPRTLIEDHPVLRHIDLSSVAFIGARELEPPDGSLVLVESENGVPLIYRATQNGRTALVVNLDPVASEFYFSAWFPVLIHGAATHLAGREEELAALYRPGDTAPIPGHREGSTTNIVFPDKTQIETQESRFGPIERLGFYQLGDWPLATSLVTAQESLLDNSAVEATADPVSRGHAPAYWLVLLAVIVLVVESILYHRRKVG
ncbi:MAG: BatA and WFA domain-containing protein [Verrucomicrobiota bacterium]